MPGLFSLGIGGGWRLRWPHRIACAGRSGVGAAGWAGVGVIGVPRRYAAGTFDDGGEVVGSRCGMIGGVGVALNPWHLRHRGLGGDDGIRSVALNPWQGYGIEIIAALVWVMIGRKSVGNAVG